ncbi:hypothetical protein AWM68_13635 [Fictibacillus phosphorivorans]|uniref:Uncharacterized protein n=1 Tax=Fictibacillus phosphorivorans TaxID=1221500 RepID=A0A163PU93_9BACL|nr:hypothetical protein [Fictibacillus phosphorivorans]KZE64143.1 hypothetical protein AWM68_13635 [Fictibacillus phosphorivorans]
MKTIQQKLAEIIVNESSSLAEQIISRRFEKYPVKEKQLFDYQSSKDYITKFIQLCGSSLLLSPSVREERLKEVAITTAQFALQYGQSLDIAMQPNQFIRSELINVIARLSEEEGYTLKETISLVQDMNQMLDLSFQCFMETYMESILQAI